MYTILIPPCKYILLKFIFYATNIAFTFSATHLLVYCAVLFPRIIKDILDLPRTFFVVDRDLVNRYNVLRSVIKVVPWIKRFVKLEPSALSRLLGHVDVLQAVKPIGIKHVSMYTYIPRKYTRAHITEDYSPLVVYSLSHILCDTTHSSSSQS